MEKSVMMEEENIFRQVNKTLSEEDILMLAPLQLAYIGDAVYELLIRTYLLRRDISVNKLHRTTTRYVKAKAQADIVNSIKDTLTEREAAVVKKGRNAKSHTSPKNADLIDYKYATGFEALIGYLYLKKDYGRIDEIFTSIINLDID